MVKKTIVYVNFSPYENAGRILDYLLDNFDTVILFLLNFHQLGKSQKPGKLVVYRNKKIMEEYPLIDLPFRIPPSLNFILLPIRSLINLFQILWYNLKLRNKYGKLNLYFTVNAFTSWIGNVLKNFKVVEKTIFWVWDYYPPRHPSKITSLMRWIYWQFDKAAINSDRVAFLNKKLEDLRKKIEIIPPNAYFPTVPIGTDPIEKLNKKNLEKIIIGFLGVLKKSEGIDIVFDSAEEMIQKFPNIEFEIIGAGPDEKYFRERAKKIPLSVKFYGYVASENEIRKIQLRWTIAIAPYIPEESNVSFYTDSSKIKSYLSLGIPVIITNVNFSKEVIKSSAGIVISYNKKEFINAVSKILNNYQDLRKNALDLSKKYYYKKLYPLLFKSLI